MEKEFLPTDYLPIGVRISDAKILIVGGGNVATHKSSILARYTHKATIVAREVSEDIKSGPFCWIEREFLESDLDDVDMLFVCTGNRSLNKQIYELARERNILTSVCDDVELCQFISPAIYRDDNLTIAVASDAKDVRRSIRVRNRIQKLIEEGILDIS